MAQTVKNLHAKQEMQAQYLGREDPLEEGMATHSSILAWRIPWTEEPGGLQSVGWQRVGHKWMTNTFTLRVESLFFKAIWLSCKRALLAFKARYAGPSSSWCRAHGPGSVMWGWDPLLLRQNLHNCGCPPVVDRLPRGVDLDYTTSSSLLPVSWDSFFTSLVVENLFC